MELELRNPEFKILDCQNPEFKILVGQNPEFRILASLTLTLSHNSIEITLLLVNLLLYHETHAETLSCHETHAVMKPM